MTLDSKYKHKMQSSDINALPLASFDGPIHLINTPRDAVVALNELRKHRVLGFDTEKRPAFRKGQVFDPSLLQLAHADAAYIFQLKATGMPKELLKLLSRTDVTKAGVAVGRDIKELQDMEPFEAGGFIDLGDKARDAGLQHHGLRGLSALLLGMRISKSAKLTNWSKKDLPQQALLYAATDAWIGLRLYEKMKALGIV